MIINSLLFLEKKLNFLIHFLQNNVHYQRIIVNYQKIWYFLLKKHQSNVQISNDNIIKIISNLDSNKDHGHDMISIRMLKLCSFSLCKSPFNYFQVMPKSNEISCRMEKSQCGSNPKKKKKLNSASKATQICLFTSNL